jgi:hypothetical protein
MVDKTYKKMIKHYIRIILEYFSHLKTDVYVLSFPKSGRTWYRFMIGNSLVNTFKLTNIPMNDILMVKKLYKYSNKIPVIYFLHENFPDWIHYQKISSNKNRFFKKRVILLVRDPRDLVVSNFYQKKYRNFKVRKGIDKKVFQGNMSDFIRYEYGGLPNIISYYNSWANNFSNHKQLLLVKYEDIKSNPLQIMINTMQFLNCTIDESSLLKAINDSSFENMRNIEVNRLLNNSRLSADNNGNEQSLKTRKGKVGSYYDELSEPDIIWMESYISNNLDDKFSFYKSET